MAANAPYFVIPGFIPGSHQVIDHVFFDDMIGFGDIGAAGWVVTEDTGGNTQVFSDVQHGIMKITNAATTDNDASQVVWAAESFKLTANKQFYFEARIRCPAGDATHLDFFVGLAESEDLTGVADNMPANGLGFRKDDGDAYIDACSSDNGTNLSTTQVGTLVDNVFIKLALHFDGGATGSGVIRLYVDGLEAGKIESVTYATMAEMAPIFMIRNGDATTTQVLDIDYVLVVAQR